MTFRLFLKYVILPALVIMALVFAVFHRPILIHYRFSNAFDDLVKYRGLNRALDLGDKIIAMGSDAEAPLLEKAVSGKDHVEQYYGLYLLGRIGSQKGVEVQRKALKSKDATTRLGAIRGLKYVMKPEYVNDVMALSGDPVREIRYEAASTLGKAYCPESIAALLDITRRDHDEYIWGRAWMSLRYLVPVEGEVIEKFRVDKRLRVIPPTETKSEVAFTFYFFKVRTASSGETVINVDRKTWNGTHVGDQVTKPKESEAIAVKASAAKGAA